jgi:hypothetical protein
MAANNAMDTLGSAGSLSFWEQDPDEGRPDCFGDVSSGEDNSSFCEGKAALWVGEQFFVQKHREQEIAVAYYARR